jgi:hypothetical protein
MRALQERGSTPEAVGGYAEAAVRGAMVSEDGARTRQRARRQARRSRTKKVSAVIGAL